MVISSPPPPTIKIDCIFIGIYPIYGGWTLTIVDSNNNKIISVLSKVVRLIRKAAMAASCSGDEDSQNRSNWRRSKPSKRIDAARFFLKNISLDGKAIDGPLQWDSKHTNGDSMFEGGLGRLHTRRLSQRQDTFEDDKKLILDLPTTSKVQLHHSTSVACTNIFKESSLKSQKAGDSVILAKSKSYVETASAGSSGKDRLNSQVSQQKPNIHLLDSRQFLTRSLKYMFGKRYL